MDLLFFWLFLLELKLEYDYLIEKNKIDYDILKKLKEILEKKYNDDIDYLKKK